METHLGLTPEEMITVFNRMYLDVWEKTRTNINWEFAKISQQMKENKEIDLTRLLLEMFEVVITATRDGFVLAMYENNEKIFNDIRMAAQRQMQASGGYSSGMESDEDEEYDEDEIDLPSA